MTKLLGGLLVAVWCSQMHASEFARVLLPVTIEEAAGALGSRWTSELWVHSNTDAGVVIQPLRLSDFLPIRKESLRLPIFYRDAGAPAQFLFVTRELLPLVHFNLRVRDLSRQSETWGTEIPVVRDEEFRSGPMFLLPLPGGDAFRSMLRVYGFDGAEGLVRVRVIAIAGDRVIMSTVLSLQASSSPYLPTYAQTSLPQGAAGESVRIDVEPVTEGFKIWTFVSITHNETQHVTTLTPQ